MQGLRTITVEILIMTQRDLGALSTQLVRDGNIVASHYVVSTHFLTHSRRDGRFYSVSRGFNTKRW